MLSRQMAAVGAAEGHQKSRYRVTRSERVLLRWYRRLGEEDQAHIMRFMTALAASAPRLSG